MKYLVVILGLVVGVAMVGTLSGGLPVVAQSSAVITLNQPFSGTIVGNGDITLMDFRIRDDRYRIAE
jgi:hypothetical protein